MTDEELRIADEALAIALPVIVAFVRAKVAGGSSADVAAAEVAALFRVGDAVVDEAENQKFGSP